MAIITRPPAIVTKKAVTIRIPEPVAAALHQCARFIGSSLDHVVVEALKLIFKKDAEFKACKTSSEPRFLQLKASEAPSNQPSPQLHLYLRNANAIIIKRQAEKAERPAWTLVHDGWLSGPRLNENRSRQRSQHEKRNYS
jgi:hypothetical protein